MTESGVSTGRRFYPNDKVDCLEFHPDRRPGG